MSSQSSLCLLAVAWVPWFATTALWDETKNKETRNVFCPHRQRTTASPPGQFLKVRRNSIWNMTLACHDCNQRSTSPRFLPALKAECNQIVETDLELYDLGVFVDISSCYIIYKGQICWSGCSLIQIDVRKVKDNILTLQVDNWIIWECLFPLSHTCCILSSNFHLLIKIL